MTSGEEYAKIRVLAAQLGIAGEKVEQYLAALFRWDLESSAEVELEAVPIRTRTKACKQQSCK